MRDYAKLVPTFWTGKTGKALKARGSEAVIVAMYLMSSPHSNMLGLYYQPVLYMAHETGLGIEGASKGLQGAIDAGFCSFDEESEMVWVFEMASFQIASELMPKDKRCIGIQKELEALPENPFSASFFEKYRSAFHLVKARTSSGVIGKNEAPQQAPSKPLRSQEQEQEQEQETPIGVQGVKPPKPPALEIPDWIPVKPWDEFVAMRRAKGKRAPFTLAAAKGIVAEIEKLKDQGQNPEQVLTQSVMNGWSGVFPVKGVAAGQPAISENFV